MKRADKTLIIKYPNGNVFLASLKEFCKWANLSKKEAIAAMHELIKKGFLVPSVEPNTYTFYEGGRMERYGFLN